MIRTRTRLIALNLVLLLLLPAIFVARAQAADDSFWITVDGVRFQSNTDKSGSGWTYNADGQSLSLNGYNGGEIRASGDLVIYCLGASTVTGEDSSNYGGNGITGSHSISIYLYTTFNVTAGSGTARGGSAIVADRVSILGSKSGKLTAAGGSGDINGTGLSVNSSFYIGPVFATFTGGGTIGAGINVPSWSISEHTDYSFSDDGHVLRISPKRYSLMLTNGGVDAHVVNGTATYSNLVDYYQTTYRLNRYIFESEGNAQVAWRIPSGNLLQLNYSVTPTCDLHYTAVWESVAPGDILCNGLNGKFSDGSLWNKGHGSATLPDDLAYSDNRIHLLIWGTDIDPQYSDEYVQSGQWYAPGSKVTASDDPLLLYGRTNLSGEFIIYDPTEGRVSAGGNRVLQGVFTTGSSLKVYALDSSYLTAPSGCSLSGWATTKGGSVAYRPGDAIDLPFNRSICLYAVWAGGGISGAPVLTSANASAGQITVKWSAVSGASKYAVYRKTAGESSWTRLTNTVTGTSYTDKSTDLKAGTTYYYTVRAYVGSAWGSYDSKGVSAKAVAAAANYPALISATASAGQITVKWSAFSGASKYAVYRKAAGENSWTRLTNTVTGTSYTDKSSDLKAGTTYYYTVRAYVGSAWGSYDTAGVSAKEK